ncbi:MAG TPA: PP2C family protein-serine/threonine phosphatase [Vicinamibacterales bacterium]|nr:PP2C family protein-serine/threonine phosphatase [Vicinamibacterales bacterium]
MPAASDDAARERRPYGPPPRPGPPLLKTIPGRIFLVAGACSLALYGVEQLVPLPVVVEIFRKVVSLACLIGLGWMTTLAFLRSRRAFLWRVRRKLILSYVFLGFVPLVLVLAFVLTGGLLLYMTVAQYVFQEGFADTIETVHQVAETSAIEIGRNPSAIQAAIDRKVANLANRYPRLSMAVVSASSAPAMTPLVSGPWTDEPPPASVPAWVTRARGFAGTIVRHDGANLALVIRAATPTVDGRRLVIADLPVDATIIDRLRDRTGTAMTSVAASGCGAGTVAGPPATRSIWTLFRQTVAFMDCTNWPDGQTGGLSVTLDAPIGRLSNRLASVQSAQIAAMVGESWWTVFLPLLVALGVLFLIIQGSALVMGGLLARSITSAVHELFVGTERVQQGDFAHRIRIESRDQLGDLADSFNRMSASIEHLLHVQREKQRLDDELRIAREIQKSLLPTGPPTMAGLDVADLCEPAREVGGDYYDFFTVGPGQLGVLIADVSGKGTSAALYMAELKGIMLALSHAEPSPRRLLIDVNRRLAGQLDTRSFITMTYLVIDLPRRTLTVARAGHTPLLVVSGGRSEVVTPDGMVLGLRIPGAEARFEALLEERTRELAPGDTIVLYTDGITEAMDAGGELFGEAALARVLASQHGLDAAGIRERVLREVKAFVGDAEPHDDMTMVVLKVTGSDGMGSA